MINMDSNLIIQEARDNPGQTLNGMARKLGIFPGSLRYRVATLAMQGKLVVHYDEKKRMAIYAKGDEPKQ